MEGQSNQNRRGGQKESGRFALQPGPEAREGATRGYVIGPHFEVKPNWSGWVRASMAVVCRAAFASKPPEPSTTSSTAGITAGTSSLPRERRALLKGPWGRRVPVTGGECMPTW